MIGMAHHLGEDQLIQALLGTGPNVLVAASTRVRRLNGRGGRRR